MTTNQDRRRHDMMAVRAVSSVTGKYGPQWQLEVQYSFSQYPTRAWVSDANGGTDDNRVHDPKSLDSPVPGQTYPCIIRRGRLSTPQDGTVRDGTKAWMYQWKLLMFGTDEPEGNYIGSATDDETPGADAAPATTQAPQPDQQAPTPVTRSIADPRQHSIERQVVFKAAVDLAIASGETILPMQSELVADAVAGLADSLWLVLQNIGQDSPPAAPDAPRSDVERTDGSDAEVDDLLTPATPNPGLARRPVDPNEGQQEPPRDAEERR